MTMTHRITQTEALAEGRSAMFPLMPLPCIKFRYLSFLRCSQATPSNTTTKKPRL